MVCPSPRVEVSGKSIAERRKEGDRSQAAGDRHQENLETRETEDRKTRRQGKLVQSYQVQSSKKKRDS
jgi:hypothetical protein